MDYWSGEIPWVSPKDFNDFYITETEDHISEEGMRQAGLKRCPQNSLLVVVRSAILSHTLPVGLTTKEVTINQDIKALIVNQKNTDAEYLGIYLDIFGSRLLPIITKHGTTVHSVNTEQFDSLLIPLPPLDIQKSLVAEIEAARQSHKQKLAQAGELLSSLDGYLLDQLGLSAPEDSEKKVFAVRLKQVKKTRLDVFNFQESVKSKSDANNGIYPNVLLAQVAEIIMGQAPSGQDYNDEEIGLPLIAGAADLGDVFPFPKKWTKSAPKQSKAGDIILCIRATIGTLNWADRVYCLGRGVAGIRPKNSMILSSYLYEVLFLRRFYLLSRGTGSTFKQVVAEEIKNCPIPLPPLNIQEIIASEMNQRRDKARQLRQEAETEWETAKTRFEQKLLGEEM